MLALTLTMAVISTLPLGGDVAAADGDYLIVEFEVPAGTVELEISHSDGSQQNILDWGIWDPAGFRGWGGGLEDNAVIGELAASRGYLPGPITPGTWQLVIGKAKIVEDPAAYVGEVTFRDAPTLAPQTRAAFDPVVLEQGPRWYKGDLHVHSEQSGDAEATFDQIVTLARSRGLDFVVLSEHNTVSQHGLQAEFQKTVDDVLLVRGNEVTTYGGHGNAVGSSAYIDHRVGLEGRTARGILEDVSAQGALFVVNHPTLELPGQACIGCAWVHADTPWDLVGAIEIQNGNYTLTSPLFTPGAIALWDLQEDAGNRIAPVGGSDDHSAGQSTGATASPIGSPTTLVYADELSEPALLRAISEGRTVVQLRGPDDPLVELSATGEAGGAPARIGDTVSSGQVTLQVQVTGGNGFVVHVLKNGVRDQAVSVDSDAWTGTFDVPVSEGGDRFRAHLIDPDNKLAVVTGHLYAVPAGAPDGGPVDGGGDAGADSGGTDQTGGDGAAPADTGPGADTGGGADTASGGGGCSVVRPSGAAGTEGAALLLIGLLVALGAAAAGRAAPRR